ncbi:polysaccharide ABC transporter ATP-binding protein [Flavobacterium sp. H122]|uniref:ABC transporter ATP-binding protein n=1 Tax=Flavobacterium sp. H122 TaxID=2529860 RepID=UPI0010AA8CCC|nr:polysaccharide ABC transporter ATP-binding protein [Flavobacterium sp. H122]
MSKIVIKAENISKQYRLGLVGTGTVRDDIKRWWYNIRGKEDPFLKIGESNDRSVKGESDYVWSLRDINFEINQGDSVGIIGRNGAGKSTLLKILSQVTQPTTGKIYTKGRIASLLEVGTGFHPEMTGRENIYLNGAILGMRKHEITRKLDEIIAFSGVERYIDTPVKRYSSGMYVRLAFAVAAHLESEILIVDEVLAVGDAEFQKKCLGKMNDVSKGEGRTVLFVSHNMAAVKSLCNKGIVLDKGNIKLIGNAENAVSQYLGGDGVSSNKRIFDSVYSNSIFKLNEINLCSLDKSDNNALNENLPIVLTTEIKFLVPDAHRYHITYHLYNEMGEPLFSFYHTEIDGKLKQGSNTVKCIFPANFFQSGNFYLSLFIVEDKKKSIFSEKDVLAFTVTDGGRELGVYMGREPGYVKPKFKWELE